MREGYDRNIFDNINNAIMESADSYAVHPYVVNKKGVKEYLGIWEYEGKYTKFKTLGAKKYAYEKDGKLTVTVSGLSKEKGSRYLESIGGIEQFKDNLLFEEEDSGRTVSYYDDNNSIRQIEIAGSVFTTSSSLAVHDTTYRLGRSGEYESLIDVIKKYGYESIT